MKKILLLLLLATFSIQAQTLQNPTYGNVKLKNNVTDNSATKVNVQSTDGTINTISKSDLVNVVEVNDVPSLPLVGEVGKIYVVKNVNKIYRWNGTFYQELAGSDISGLQAQIDLKENTFSKNTAFNKNFGTTAGTVAEGNDSRILNGQTAYSWGNHAGLYPSLTGTGATGTWGIDISGSSSKWSGYINGFAAGNQETSVGGIVGIRTSDNAILTYTSSAVQSFLGLGSNAYSSTAYLPLSGGAVNGTVLLNSTDGGVLSFQTNSLPLALMTSSRNIIGAGSTTDFNTYVYGNNPYNIWTNGVKRVTVDGSGNVDFTGTVTASSATLDTQLATLGQVKGTRPYKVYTALLSQSGTNAPVATVLENTLGGSVVWTRTSTGSYLGTLTGVFTANKTFCTTTIGAYLSGGSNSIGLVRNSVDDVFLFTNRGIAGTDAILNDASIEIRVYDSPLD